MNIAIYFEYQINPERGGTERVTDILAHYFVSNGHNVFYLSKVPVDGVYDIQTFFLPSTSGFATPKNIEFINNFICENKIDLLINQAGNLDDVYLFSHQALESDIKIITCIHFPIHGGTNYYYNALSLPKVELNKPLLSFKNILRWAMAPYFKANKIKRIRRRNCFIQRDSDSVVLLASSYIQEMKLFSNLQSSNNLTYINNPNTYENTYLKSNKQKEIIFVGRLHEHKRPEYLLNVWGKLHLQFPDWTLTFVGDGPLKNKLESIVRKKKLAHVNFEGFTNSYKYYERASILCLTSLFEGFPMVILEAKQNGVIPVIYNTFSASTDLIENGKTGFVIEPFNVVDYADCLSHLMLDESLRNRISKNSYEDSKRFNIKLIGLQWDNLLSHLMKNKK